MTRFWLSLKEGVEFSISSFNKMHGGEIFIPKTPSILITDLAKAMAPSLEYKIIGIRPGEKIHETLCPSDDSHLTLKFKNHFVITPSIDLDVSKKLYMKDMDGEKGEPVDVDFEYSSKINDHFLSIEEIKSKLSK